MAFVNRLLSDLYQFLESLQMLINPLWLQFPERRSTSVPKKAIA
jgi:hypothetical protein